MSPSFEPTTYLCQGLTELTFGHPSNFDNFCCCFSLLLFCKVILRCKHILKTDVFSFYLSISLSPFSLWVHWRLYIRVLLLSIVESSTRLHNKATRPSTFLSLSRGWNISFVADCKYWWGLSKELCICQTNSKLPSDLSNPLAKNNWPQSGSAHPFILFIRSFLSVSIHLEANWLNIQCTCILQYWCFLYIFFRNGIKRYRTLDFFGKIWFLFCTPGLPFGSMRSAMKY